MLRCWSSDARTLPLSRSVPAVCAFARALKVQIADVPHPPEGSPTIGMKAIPCATQSSAVFK